MTPVYILVSPVAPECPKRPALSSDLPGKRWHLVFEQRRDFRDLLSADSSASHFHFIRVIRVIRGLRFSLASALIPVFRLMSRILSDSFRLFQALQGAPLPPPILRGTQAPRVSRS